MVSCWMRHDRYSIRRPGEDQGGGVAGFSSGVKSIPRAAVMGHLHAWPAAPECHS
jgi:hypothetical protein